MPPEEFDRQVVKPKVSKNKKAKTISRVVVDDNNIKYAKVVETLVEKPTKLMHTSDYKFTTIELGKQSCLVVTKMPLMLSMCSNKRMISYGK